MFRSAREYMLICAFLKNLHLFLPQLFVWRNYAMSSSSSGIWICMTIRLLFKQIAYSIFYRVIIKIVEFLSSVSSFHNTYIMIRHNAVFVKRAPLHASLLYPIADDENEYKTIFLLFVKNQSRGSNLLYLFIYIIIKWI